MMDGSGSMFFGGGFMWIFWLLVVVVILAVAKAMTGSKAQREDDQNDDAVSVLEKRYARGEIRREEYEEKKARSGRLSGHSQVDACLEQLPNGESQSVYRWLRRLVF